MAGQYQVPSYRHVVVEGHPARAYLVLSADVTGQWQAGYHAWLGETYEGNGQYVAVEPIVEGALSPAQALRRMKRALKDYGE